MIVVQPHNNIWVKVSATDIILEELERHFSFSVPVFNKNPTQYSSNWDGQIKLFNPRIQRLYAGLVPHLEFFAKQKGYEIAIHPDMEKKTDLTAKQCIDFAKSLNLSVETETEGRVDIVPHSYQFSYFYESVVNNRRVNIAPTAAGKSLIIYMLCRWFQKHEPEKQILLVSDSIGLRDQLYSDFEDYAFKDETWDIEDNVLNVAEPEDRNKKMPIMICTWQGLTKSKRPPTKAWFNRFNTVMIDECHVAQAKSLKWLLTKLDCKHRYGFTGTLQDTECHRLVIEGLLGKAVQFVTTQELMEKNKIAKAKVSCKIIKYSSEDLTEWQNQTDKSYQAETDFILKNYARNKWVADFAVSLGSNTAVLFWKLDHGAWLKELIEESLRGTGRKVYLINGATEREDMLLIRQLSEKEKDSIFVASYGVFAKGVNIKNLHNMILSSPFKSKIRLLQSIGRTLRLHPDKDFARIFDISDDLRIGNNKNYGMLHFTERVKIYAREQFNYVMEKVKLQRIENTLPL